MNLLPSLRTGHSDSNQQRLFKFVLCKTGCNKHISLMSIDGQKGKLSETQREKSKKNGEPENEKTTTAGMEETQSIMSPS
jgi:hypothetical protein